MTDIIELLKRYDQLQQRALAQELASGFQPASDKQDEQQKLQIINNITAGNSGIGVVPQISTTYPVSSSSQQRAQPSYTWNSAGYVWGAGGWTDPGRITANQGTPYQNVATAMGPMPGTQIGGGYGVQDYGRGAGAGAIRRAR